MQYVKYGQTDLLVSRLGLGCMRLPEDEKAAIEIVQYAFDHGINYFDTAYAYTGKEEILGRALRGERRARAVVATKSPSWLINEYGDLEKYLDISLKRLQTDYIDVYLMHDLKQVCWKVAGRFDIAGFMQDMIRKGKIKCFAYSIHADMDHFKYLLELFKDAAMVQIQLNYLDIDFQAGLEGLRMIAAQKKAAVLMEVARGGNLVDRLPDEAARIMNSYDSSRSPAEWAYRWAANLPEATVILTGVQTLGQLQENIKIFETAYPDAMSGPELAIIDQVRAEFKKKQGINCTSCRYCMPCPNGVSIAQTFAAYNDLMMLGDADFTMRCYREMLTDTGTDATQCSECGICEPRCPQGIPIIEKLKEAHRALTPQP